MNRRGDAASCAALAGLLRAGAHDLSAAAAAGPATADGPSGVSDLTRTLTALADALADFATGLRDPRPPRAGRPHPHTALRAACREIVASLDDQAGTAGLPDTDGRPQAGSPQRPR